ncbi:hypothetical protein Avbf_02670 [Armadillidium vulgare]|nr:hypothetical protein Avbf_02670 [Armadillidium vulgare]
MVRKTWMKSYKNYNSSLFPVFHFLILHFIFPISPHSFEQFFIFLILHFIFLISPHSFELILFNSFLTIFGNEGDIESLMDDETPMGNVPVAGESQEESSDMSYSEERNPFLHRGVSEMVSPSISPEIISEEPTNYLNQMKGFPLPEEEQRTREDSSVSPDSTYEQTDNRNIEEMRNPTFPIDMLGNISPSTSPEVNSHLPLRSLNDGRGSAFPKRFQEISPSMSPDMGFQPPLKVLHSSGNPLVDRGSLERIRESTSIPLVDRGSLERVREGNSNHIPVPSYRKEGQPILNPLVKITLPSPLKTIPSMINDGMPKIEGGLPSKTLNKSVKNLINEDFEMRPGHRPPTPARPSLPTLLGGKSDSSQDSSVSSSTEALPKNRRGHVVPLPPIGQTVGGNVNEITSQNNNDKESVLSVAKKTLERLENVLSPSEKLNKKKPLPRSRTVNQLNMSP